MAKLDETDEIVAVERIAKSANTLRSEVDTLYEGWKERYAARASITRFLLDKSVMIETLRDTLMELL